MSTFILSDISLEFPIGIFDTYCDAVNAANVHLIDTIREYSYITSINFRISTYSNENVDEQEVLCYLEVRSPLYENDILRQ